MMIDEVEVVGVGGRGELGGADVGICAYRRVD